MAVSYKASAAAISCASVCELRDANIVAFEPGHGYSLGEQGHTLLDALTPLHGWAERWDVRRAARAES